MTKEQGNFPSRKYLFLYHNNVLSDLVFDSNLITGLKDGESRKRSLMNLTEETSAHGLILITTGCLPGIPKKNSN